MKKLINFNILFLIFINFCLGQEKVSGYVLDEDTNLPLNNVAIYDNNSDQIYYSDSDGYFEFMYWKSVIGFSDCIKLFDGAKKGGTFVYNADG